MQRTVKELYNFYVLVQVNKSVQIRTNFLETCFKITGQISTNSIVLHIFSIKTLLIKFKQTYQ
jgi:Ca2+-binding EF-hand superfamily protein